jgi:hypothetical protein
VFYRQRGGADVQSIDAARCVVTVPLGVLKSNAIVFSPPLSARKRDAIDTLGVGNENRVVLRFETRFWPDCEGYFVTLVRQCFSVLQLYDCDCSSCFFCRINDFVSSIMIILVTMVYCVR